MIRALEAFVLHKNWLGDSSAKVIFFTRELGLLHCFYKAGRKPQKQALLQAFHPLWLAVNDRYDRHYIHSLESRAGQLELSSHALFSGLYLNELLYYALCPMTPEPDLFNAYALVLAGLGDAKERQQIESLLRRFEWALLKTCGYSFSLSQEARTSAPIKAEACYLYREGEGLISVEKGIPGEHILALAADNLREAATLRSAKILMRQAIDHLVGGREIISRSLFQKATKT